MRDYKTPMKPRKEPIDIPLVIFALGSYAGLCAALVYWWGWL